MNLIEPIKYPEGCGKWSLVGPVWCEMDDQLHALCERFTLTTRENADNLKRAGQLESDAQLIYEFKAASGEEASTIHYERQGWKPYQPIGESAVCPNQCGSFYYPLGSGDCPVCGHIG